ncbi:acyltransferase family protein [Sphingosinicella microcystinivorans]|uniref:Acyltransferase n=1 Tax=Sphingosinicella microcystinivorans TaxID=335406 RepID=A0AAD1D4G9_SPHMI|nr:acyltransferase family protein [Sphingosinicella microcystinivorans]RKS90550.1 peptidoglycan/LPS O-acetylase OafA/YrhL [Sphingosinicella microcystinivorans]BBE33465.1 acyltransferase [Sphingosinicella microcystinivorans]
MGELQSSGPPAGRHYGMDWLRVGAFALLILYHVGMYFVPWDWHVKAAQPEPHIAILMLATNSWRLALLFVVSGYASAAVFARQPSPAGFARSRSSRLLIPLVFAIIILIPPQPWIELMFKHGYTESFGHFWLHDYFRFGALDGIILPTWQHLWFVVYLWVYSMVLALLMLLPASLRARIARLCEAVLAGPAILALPITLMALRALILFPGVGETHALVDDGAAHALYFPCFLFGVLLRGSSPLWVSVRRWWRVAAVLAVAAYAVVAAIEYRYPGETLLDETLTALFRGARAVQGWSTIIAMIGIADRWLNRDAPIRTTLTEAVFPLYIAHQTIIVVVGWWLLPLALPNLAAFAVLVVATAAGSWAFYIAGRSISPLRPLIGLAAKEKGRPEGRPSPTAQ